MSSDHQSFSRRERQIMDVIYRKGHATASEVMDEILDPPGYSTVRTLLGVLEKKGHLTHERRGYHYVYTPTIALDKVSTSMLEHVMHTFFEGSAERVVSALLDISESDLTNSEYDKILEIVKDAKKDGR